LLSVAQTDEDFMAKDYNQATDEQIRTRAYYIWEAEGRPQGRDWEYWLKAKEELENGNSGSNSAPRKTASSTSAEPARKRTASRSPVFA
jgi:hypothetical protein